MIPGPVSGVSPRLTSTLAGGTSPVIFPFAHRQASRGHSEGLQWSSKPSSRLPKEPLHRNPVGPVQPTLLLGGSDPQLWWGMSTSAAESSGKKVYPE